MSGADSPMWVTRILVEIKCDVQIHRICDDYRLIFNPHMWRCISTTMESEDFMKCRLRNRYFSKLDLKSACFQIPMLLKSKLLSTISTLWVVSSSNLSPSDLLTPSVIFQTVINEVIQYLNGVLFHYDDVIILEPLEKGMIQVCGCYDVDWYRGIVFVQPVRRKFDVSELEFLSFKIIATGYQTDLEYLEPLALLAWPRNEVHPRSSMECMKYYSRSSPTFATTGQPLFLAQPPSEWQWTDEYERILRTSSKDIVDPRYIRGGDSCSPGTRRMRIHF